MTVLSTKRSLPVFNSYFDDFFTRDLIDFPFKKAAATAPAVNIKELENEFLIELAAPGMNKSDFRVNIDGDSLTISSVREDKKEESNENFTRREFCYSSFKRSFTLPADLIDMDRITANYENGILQVSLPKIKEAKISKTKEIKVA